MAPRPRSMIWVAAGAAGVGAGAALFLLLTAPHGADGLDPPAVALGGQIYAVHCAQCHGAHLEGQPDWQQRRADGRLPAPPQDASGHSWHHPDAHLFAIAKEGMSAFAPPGYESDMPAFKDVLTDAEIRAVLAFIKSTWPERERAYQAARSNAGAD
jgi:mono/diheme cytochrome c family protein